MGGAWGALIERERDHALWYGTDDVEAEAKKVQELATQFPQREFGSEQVDVASRLSEKSGQLRSHAAAHGLGAGAGVTKVAARAEGARL